MRYRLYYSGYLLGKVEHSSSDFPNLWGHYQPALAIDCPESAHVRDYIAFCVRTDPLRELDRIDEIDPLEEEAFRDLIESDAWSLVEADSNRALPILIPLFCKDGGFVWRWNLTVHTSDEDVAGSGSGTPNDRRLVNGTD